MFTAIADTRRIDEEPLAALARALRGADGELRCTFDGHEGSVLRFGAAVRNPGFLPEDQFDGQPLHSPNGDTIFVCQVRLDNREELLETLGPWPCRPAELADSSILFAAYLKWGEACNERLTGDYAYAAYSKTKRTLTAAVDHGGHFRLYYAVSPGRIILSTQLAAFRASPALSLSCNEIGIGLLVEARFTPGETCYNEIQALRSGHSLKWDSGQVQTRHWWQPDTSARRQFANPNDYIEAADELFGRAVKSCLRSATAISTTLSGGLDSGLVTARSACILHESGEQLIAYTSAPNFANASFERQGWDADDSVYAAQTARLHSNVEHVVVRSDERVALDLSAQIRRLSGNPVRNGTNYLWIDRIAHAAAATGSRVLLTGAGGNFSISYAGNGAFAQMFWNLRWSAALAFAVRVQGAGERAAWKTIIEGIFPPRLFDLGLARLQRGILAKSGDLPLVSEAFRRQQIRLLRPRSPSGRSRAALLYKAQADHGIWMADPLAQWGIDMRDPTTDRRLLAFLLGVPLEVFSPSGVSRGLARELGKGILPDAVRLRRTRGEQIADCAAAVRRQIGRYYKVQRAMASSPACRRIFDPGAVRAGLDRLANGEASPILCSKIDRAMDAAAFLLENEGIGLKRDRVCA